MSTSAVFAKHNSCSLLCSFIIRLHVFCLLVHICKLHSVELRYVNISNNKLRIFNTTYKNACHDFLMIQFTPVNISKIYITVILPTIFFISIFHAKAFQQISPPKLCMHILFPLLQTKLWEFFMLIYSTVSHVIGLSAFSVIFILNLFSN
jgi:hypothetical protein